MKKCFILDDFMQTAVRGQGPQLIEEVVDWKEVAHKYLTIQGLLDEKSDDDDEKGGSAAIAIENEQKQ